MKKRHGRPPHKAQPNTKTTLTIKIDADIMFYDTVEYTPNPEWVHKRAETNPEKQWIVIVDYHF